MRTRPCAVYILTTSKNTALYVGVTNNLERRLFEHRVSGRKAEAITEGERGAALLPVSVDVMNGLYNEAQLARIYVIAGEQEKALDLIERLMKAGHPLSPGVLRIDPNFAPLRGNPRFQKLIGQS